MAFFILTDDKLQICDRALTILRLDGIQGNAHFFAYGYAIRVVDRGGDVRQVEVSIRCRKRPDSIKMSCAFNDGFGAVSREPASRLSPKLTGQKQQPHPTPFWVNHATSKLILCNVYWFPPVRSSASAH
jgi:hypothetical protein